MAERQEQQERRRFEQAEVLDNLRFVRDRAGDPRRPGPFVGLNLQDANLNGVDLACAPRGPHCTDLTGADLVGANLFLAILTAADLTRAVLTDANLHMAILSDADLTDANLAAANLHAAKLLTAILPGADLTGANLTDADLAGANLTDADFTGANLTGADLTGANLTGAKLTSSPTSAPRRSLPGRSACLPCDQRRMRLLRAVSPRSATAFR